MGPSPAQNRVIFSNVPRTVSSCILKISTNETPQPLCKDCPCVWPPSQKEKCFLVYRWYFVCFSVYPLPHLCHWALWRRVWPLLYYTHSYLHSLIRSPWSLLSSRLNTLSSLSCSSYDRHFRLSTISIGLCWRFSSSSISLLYLRDQNRSRYSRYNLTDMSGALCPVQRRHGHNSVGPGKDHEGH